ncbi:hypothetical protein F9L33_07460 [Amylibacter sp. SFDW26]|uniref:LPS assembly lipoprotein LptE n=1 Tax=Amylibacter sp. SFDW26 TaxID=2652722 RepID=UPI001261B464|nr:LPS assembly lipoprotein LptE [Amylibacter sp. SFDW26]KAB7614471.1 hypothetical protein F9L33_07460 [Amylibacter sp. SFDW26]
MSLYNRRTALAALISASLLGGCGFSPIYGEGTAADGLRGTIDITSGKGREFFAMRERLVERFGFTSAPKYRLSFTYKAESEGLAVSTTAEVTRFNLDGTSDFKVVDADTGAVLLTGTVTSKTAYSATSETFPTRVAEQDARSRLALALADQIVTRVSATAPKWAK